MAVASQRSMITAQQAANYVCSYVECYRAEYTRLTAHPRGYPQMRISPYLDATAVTAYLASDGAAVAIFEELSGMLCLRRRDAYCGNSRAT